ncbi:hypothetical protein LINGRAPRIM_LOCUS625 [Linum grandiflorum]
MLRVFVFRGARSGILPRLLKKGSLSVASTK